MKNVLISFLLFTSIQIMAQQVYPKTAFLEKWENSKNYLLEIAQAMPEAFYNYKPTEREMSFKEQLIHIKGNMDWLSNTYFTKEKYVREKNEIPETKQETILLLKEAFEATSFIIKQTEEKEFQEIVDFFAGPKSKLQILNLLQDHVTHHRGQLIVYLNLKDIEPPRYIGW